MLEIIGEADAFKKKQPNPKGQIELKSQQNLLAIFMFYRQKNLHRNYYLDLIQQIFIV